MKFQPISSLLRVISQPARIEILLAIGSDEACVCHLEAATGQRQAYISQQLMALREAGVVANRREGKYIYYRLANLAILDLIHQATVISGNSEYDLLSIGPLNLHGKCPCPKCEPT